MEARPSAPRLPGKRWLLLAAGIIALGIIVVALCTMDFKWTRAVTPVGEPLEVSAEQIRKDFQEDLQQATRRYVGRILIVTGMVHGLPGSLENPEREWEIVLTGKDADPNEFPWISCRVPWQRKASFSSVGIADTVTIQGVCYNATNVAVRVKECKLIAHWAVHAK